MKNQVIKALNDEHGQRILAYFRSLGFDTANYAGTSTVANNSTYIYYGVVAGQFGNWGDSIFTEGVAVELILLPEVNPYPKVMYVSDFKDDFKDKRKRVVFIEKGGRFLAWVSAETLEGAETELSIMDWSYAKDITEEAPEVIVELTMKDISEGKGVGIAPHLIRIKE